MTTSYYADRENLYHLHQRHPSWTQPQLAHALGRSTDWVKKWLKRFREAHTHNTPLPEVFKGLSRARKQPPAKTDPFIVERILEIRAHPPEGLRRTPGPKAIQYYLARDPAFGLFANSIPRSSRTIYRYLKEHGCIQERPVRHHEPMERPPALQCWQLDFKDVSSARADPSDPFPKQQHQVQTYDAVDMGTSILLDAQVRPDLTAETALRCVIQSLQQYGRPASITVDRDTRWVGSPQGSDFPSALHRFCACLGIELKVCDPHHPQQNNDVEQCFGSIRWHERRTTGHKQAVPGLEVRGPVRVLAAAATHYQCFCVQALQLRDPQAWYDLRDHLAYREENRRMQFHFRKDPSAFLATLEDMLIKPSLPP